MRTWVWSPISKCKLGPAACPVISALERWRQADTRCLLASYELQVPWGKLSKKNKSDREWVWKMNVIDLWLLHMGTCTHVTTGREWVRFPLYFQETELIPTINLVPVYWEFSCWTKRFVGFMPLISLVHLRMHGGHFKSLFYRWNRDTQVLNNLHRSCATGIDSWGMLTTWSKGTSRSFF